MSLAAPCGRHGNIENPHDAAFMGCESESNGLAGVVDGRKSRGYGDGRDHGIMNRSLWAPKAGRFGITVQPARAWNRIYARFSRAVFGTNLGGQYQTGIKAEISSHLQIASVGSGASGDNRKMVGRA